MTTIASTALLLAAALSPAAKTMTVQVSLDRAGYSCNAIDGVWGRKSQSALARYCADRGVAVPASASEAYDTLFPNARPRDVFKFETVTAEDLASLVQMPDDPAEKAELDQMGYPSILEMFAERGHLSRRALKRLNPRVDWSAVRPGTKIVIPSFPSMDEELDAWPRGRPGAPARPDAALVKVSLSRFEITAYDGKGRLLALFPCSIAKDKAKLPPRRELKTINQVARPNYTYTPDVVPPDGRVSRHILPEGPRNPVGVAWLGLDLPGYGIHGTPSPETVGNAESHGCFRLANWNAARLYAICPVGTKVLVEP